MTYPGTPDPTASNPADQQKQEQHKRSKPPVDPAVSAAVGGALGLALLFWVLRRLRLRRRPQTPTEKLVHAGREATTAVGHQAGRLAGEAGEVAGRAAAVAGPALLAGAGLLADQGKRVGERAAELGSHAAHAGAHVGEEVVETPEHAQKRVGRFFLKLLAVLSFGGGYVLGAQAGRERYDQIMRGVGEVRTRIGY